MADKTPARQPESRFREQFCRYCRLLYERSLVSGSGGNIAARWMERILLTPSGYALRDVTPSRVSVVDREGTLLAGETPTKDAGVHLELLRCRDDIDVVVHVHGAHIIAASVLLEPGPDSLPPLTPGFVYTAHPLPMLPFLVPGSQELVRASTRELSTGSRRALLLQNHGLITLGRDFPEALNIAEEVEEAARVFLLTGGKGRLITRENCSKIRRIS